MIRLAITRVFKTYGGLTMIPVSGDEVQLTLVARGNIKPSPNNYNELFVQEYEPERPKTPLGRLREKYLDPQFDGIGRLLEGRILYPLTLDSKNPSASVSYERCEDRGFTVRLSANTPLSG